MAKERKKTELKVTVKPVIPKQRLTPKTNETTKKLEPEEPILKIEKRKKNDFKTIRIALGSDIEERKQISDRVNKGELTFACYAIDGENGYHYYFINKN
jgi:hypothetical protein